MSETITREDGTTIEVFTQEELEAQREVAKQEAIEAYKAENPDKTEELTALQAELAKKEEALANAANKDLNITNLRKAKEAAEKKLADFSAELDNKITSAKKEVLEGVMKDHYNETLSQLSGGDEELKKKIEFNFKRLGDVASTKQELTKKFQDAARLSGVEERDAVNTSVFSSGGVGRLNIKTSEKKLTEDEKAVGAKLGLSAEDLKKYGK